MAESLEHLFTLLDIMKVPVPTLCYRQRRVETKLQKVSWLMQFCALLQKPKLI